MNILVVEDEVLIRLGMASLVEGWGYSVLEAANAAQALSILEEGIPVAVMVTDVDMPGAQDGIGLAHRVRERWPKTQIIVLSGKVAVPAERLPADVRFFAKPCPDEVLLSVIRDFTQQEADL